MMGRYRRTVSFSNPIPSFNSNSTHLSKHVRSISLPCGRTHPLISQLRIQITELGGWIVGADLIRDGSARMIDGLTRLKSVLDTFDDVLQLPQTLDALSSRTDIVESLLEDFLIFVDVYEVFRGAMLGLKDEVSTAQVSTRRKDGFNLGLYVKAQKKIGGEINKLINNVGSLTEQPGQVVQSFQIFSDDLADVIFNVRCLIVSISEMVFRGVSASFGPGRKPSWAGLGFKKGKREEGGVVEFVKVLDGVENIIELNKKKNNKNNISNEKNEMKVKLLKMMQEMEECVETMEKESEKVFRSLISTRVSLLNILTHA